MEGPETVQSVMLEGDWGVKIDLESAFNHVWVSHAMQPFLCSRYADNYYAYVGMPFGSKHAPRLFTEALGFAIRYIRANWDVRVVAYMDDILILQQDRTKCELFALQIAAYLQCLGWTLSAKKCVFEPSQELEFLGWLWNTRSLTLRMTTAMRSAVLQLIHMWLGRALRWERANSKELGGLIGSLNFLRAQVPRASLYLRGLHSTLADAVRTAGWLHAAETASDDDYGCLGRGLVGLPRNGRAMLADVRLLLSIGWAHLQQPERNGSGLARVIVLQTHASSGATTASDRAVFSLLEELDVRIHIRHIPGVENNLTDALSR
jgi:hypothetical protein